MEREISTLLHHSLFITFLFLPFQDESLNFLSIYSFVYLQNYPNKKIANVLFLLNCFLFRITIDNYAGNTVLTIRKCTRNDSAKYRYFLIKNPRISSNEKKSVEIHK